MFNFQKTKVHVAVAAVVFAMSALGSTSGWTQTQSAKPADSQKDSLKKAQQDKDLEHEMVQSDGVNHPREIVKSGDAAKKTAAKKAPVPKTLRPLPVFIA